MDYEEVVNFVKRPTHNEQMALP